MSDNYVGRIDPTDESWKSSKWTALLKERYYLASLFCENKVVLDSCCGMGWGTLNYIIPKAKYTVGFDICDSAEKTYGKSNNYIFMTMDGKQIEIKDQKFDLVLSLDAIEHFNKSDGIKYLSGIQKTCKANAVIIGTTPLVIDDSLIPTYLEWNKYHLFMYTKNSLRKALKTLFTYVNIYEIYNKVCPYFLFICWNSKIDACMGMELKIKDFISSNKIEFQRVRVSNYLSWAKMLIGKMRLLKASYLFYMACLIKLRILWNESKNNVCI